MMATLLSLAGYLLTAVCALALVGLVMVAFCAAFPPLMKISDSILGLIFYIMAGVTGYYIMHTALISEFLPGQVLVIAHVAIEKTRSWWPELIHTSIVGLSLRLLNVMWGSPLLKPSADSDMKSALIGVALYYLIYIVCSMAVSFQHFGASLLLKTFVISLTFALVDALVKPSSVSDMAATLGTIATALMAFFCLVAMSLVVFTFLHTWVVILLPSADHHAGTFASTVGFAFVAMKAMLDVMLVPAVDEPPVFSGMKAELLGVAATMKGYHGAYVVIRNLTVLAVPLVSMESRRGASKYQLYPKAALIVALGLLLTMQPGTPTAEMPAFTLVSDDAVQQTFTSFVFSQIKGMNPEIKEITDS